MPFRVVEAWGTVDIIQQHEYSTEIGYYAMLKSHHVEHINVYNVMFLETNLKLYQFANQGMYFLIFTNFFTQ